MSDNSNTTCPTCGALRMTGCATCLECGYVFDHRAARSNASVSGTSYNQTNTYGSTASSSSAASGSYSSRGTSASSHSSYGSPYARPDYGQNTSNVKHKSGIFGVIPNIGTLIKFAIIIAVIIASITIVSKVVNNAVEERKQSEEKLDNTVNQLKDGLQSIINNGDKDPNAPYNGY